MTPASWVRLSLLGEGEGEGWYEGAGEDADVSGTWKSSLVSPFPVFAEWTSASPRVWGPAEVLGRSRTAVSRELVKNWRCKPGMKRDLFICASLLPGLETAAETPVVFVFWGDCGCSEEERVE